MKKLSYLFSKTICLLILLTVAHSAASSQAPLNNLSGRQKTSLNGTWNYIVDPYENGYYNFRMEPFDQQKNPSNSAFFKNYHPQNKQELIEYDFDKSPKIEIPGDWNSQDEKLLYYEGTVWFKKSFDYALKENRRLFIHFGAVNYIAEVYLNGTKLGVHEGGFTPFGFEITSLAKPKDNFVVVKVDNKRRVDGVPTLNTDWWNYGGITRDVFLIDEPTTYIDDYSIGLKRGDMKTIAGFVQLNGTAAAGEEIELSIPVLGIVKKIKTTAGGRAEFEIPAKNLKYWSPDDPKLYGVSIKTRFQTLKDDIGFRTIETKGAQILLNGAPVFLRGISIHEENSIGGRVTSRTQAAQLLNWARDLGCNFVRLAHYPHNEYMVRLADEMGLMVWEEIPVYWTIDFTSQNVYKKAAQQLTETIRRDRNRASVVIWSMANETPVSDARNKFIGDLATHARTMDGTRLVSAALLHGTKNGADTVDDPIGAKLDIVAFNQYLGWYGGNLENAESVKWSIPYNKPVVVSEFGGGAKFGLRGEKNERWTEDYQEYLYVQNLKMIDKIPNISGMSPWILKDFRSPRRMLAGIQDGYNRKGLFSDVGERKRAFYVLQDYYKKKGGETSYKLVWADEFDKDGQPDPSKWSYESGYIRNREKQYYTNRPENVRVESGNLVIEARKEAIKNPGFASTDSKNWKANREFTEYTSASITTRDKAEWLYGKIDIRARLPKGRGAWSALWMLGANWDEVGWPRCGEIDIVENVGFEPTTVHATVHTLAYNHTRGTQRGKTTELADIYNDYHVYSIEWTPEKIDFLVDGKIYNSFANEHKTDAEWPYDQMFHLKINNAIGGDWGGKQGIDDSSFPQMMYVDWVRVYQMK